MKDITLLNKQTYLKKTLLGRMENDSFYYGELNKIALSSSSLKLLLESPKKYYYVTKYGNNEETQPLRDGFLLHTLVLEPQKFDELHFVDVASKNTKKYKEAKEEFGKVYTSKEKKDAERLADALLRNEKALQLIGDAQHEVPAIGMVQGMPFRGKADILGKNRICDLKSCSDIKNFKWSAKKYGYDIQTYLYCELFDVHWLDMSFLVLDKGSLDVGVFEISEEFFEAGKQKVTQAINIYKEYFENKDIMNDDFSDVLDNYYITEKLK